MRCNRPDSEGLFRLAFGINSGNLSVSMLRSLDLCKKPDWCSVLYLWAVALILHHKTGELSFRLTLKEAHNISDSVIP